MRAKIRKLATFVEETCTEMGRAIQPPTRRAACVAVIENPCAGKYVEDLTELMDIGEELGELLTQRAVAALEISGNTVESYGKAAAVGENGELEHAAAFVRSHFDGMEVRLNDAPRANEIMLAIAVTDSGRPLPRVGGLTKDQIKGEDGLR